MNISLPERIICLTEETTEVLCHLGVKDKIIGITEYTVRPNGIQNEKPVVSRYIHAEYDEIINLKPDIVFAWSNLQSKITAELVKKVLRFFILTIGI